MAYRKADPVPDAHGESMVLEWAVRRAGADAPRTVPAVHPEDHAERRHPVHHPHRRSRRGCCRGQAVGAVGQHGDHRHPLARQGHPHPAADAPQRRGHMAMLVAAGFLDNLCLEAEGRRILVKGRTSKEMVMVETARRRRSTGRSSRPPWSPWTCTTERSPTSPHKTARPKSRATRPRHPSTGKRRGLASSGRNTLIKEGRS